MAELAGFRMLDNKSVATGKQVRNVEPRGGHYENNAQRAPRRSSPPRNALYNAAGRRLGNDRNPRTEPNQKQNRAESKDRALALAQKIVTPLLQALALRAVGG